MMQDHEGILLVDKPPGVTSFGVVQRVKRWFRLTKAGHTGTLDPFATGLLVICIGRSTRLSHYITEWDKEYEGVIKLGVETDTDDPTGRVTFEGDISNVDARRVKEVMASFVGIIKQVPPLYSAKKVRGTPSYRLARKGRDVEARPATVRIDWIEVTDYVRGEIRFKAGCSKGTYMRALARDVGRALGCGGHLAQLRRTRVGELHVSEAWSLEALRDLSREKLRGAIIPQAEVFRHWKAVALDPTALQRVRHGADVRHCSPDGTDNAALGEGEMVRLMDDQGRLAAIGRVLNVDGATWIHPEKVITD